MGQERTERINSIISRRKPLVEDIQNIRSNISKVTSSFDKMFPVCQAILNDESLAPEFQGMSGVIDACSRPLGEIRKLNDELALLQNRFSRDTLNIAVIGRARQGKSKLLQTITGLGVEEIPDGNQGFCTGVRSDIINTQNLSSAYAQVNFLTERQFIEERIAPYFHDLQGYKAGLFTPSSIYDFQTMKLPEPGTFTESSEVSAQMNLHLKHLKDLQEHLPQYQEYLGRGPIRIERGQIREYVAQDNAKGERIYFKHMAVDSVEIFCTFPNSDVGKLRLIDLPGLGDTRMGDTEQLVKALSDQVDLVIFLTKPANTGASWGENEIKLYGKARIALGDKLPIERWSFWCFNHDSRDNADNLLQCVRLRDTIRDEQIQVSGTMIADCTKKDEVYREIIDEALEFLAANIERNDAAYAGYIQNDISRSVSQLRENISRLQAMTQEGRAHDDDEYMFGVLFNKLWKELTNAIQSLVDGKQSALRDARNTPCIPMKERIETIFAEAESGKSFPFTEESIQKEIGSSGAQGIYYDGLHVLRTQLGNRMQANMDDILNAVMTAMKDQFGHALGHEGRLAGKFGCDNHEILGRIVEYIKENELSDRAPTILYGLELLDGWKLNYRSFAQYKIREALNCLDPLDEFNKSQETPRDAPAILDMLQFLYEHAVAEMRRKFGGPNGIYHEPNNAAFAIAEEFKDIMIRSGSDEDALKLEWSSLYRPIKGDVWPNEFGSSQKKRDALAGIRRHAEEISRVLADFPAMTRRTA